MQMHVTHEMALGCCLFISACSILDAHQNYLTTTQLQVGRSIDDLYALRNRYPDRVVGRRALPNGNIEEEMKDGMGLRCRTFFEIDPNVRKIVGWRYEGSKSDCAIPP